MTGRIRHCYCPECQDERRVEGQDELRGLAAARDKKRDVAALTLMAINLAGRQADGDPACPVCAAYRSPIANDGTTWQGIQHTYTSDDLKG